MMQINIQERDYTRYPYLGTTGKKIVLFFRPGRGVVISNTDERSSDVPGLYSDGWDETAFTHFYGTLSMSNEP